jgi:hypothetical protein
MSYNPRSETNYTSAELEISLLANRNHHGPQDRKLQPGLAGNLALDDDCSFCPSVLHTRIMVSNSVCPSATAKMYRSLFPVRPTVDVRGYCELEECDLDFRRTRAGQVISAEPEIWSFRLDLSQLG